MKKHLFAIAIAVIPAFAATASLAAEREIFPRLGFRQESNFERNAREFKPAYERIQSERVREEMRDKSHDNRIIVDKRTSVGAGREGINVRRSID